MPVHEAGDACSSEASDQAGVDIAGGEETQRVGCARSPSSAEYHCGPRTSNRAVETTDHLRATLDELERSLVARRSTEIVETIGLQQREGREEFGVAMVARRSERTMTTVAPLRRNHAARGTQALRVGSPQVRTALEASPLTVTDQGDNRPSFQSVRPGDTGAGCSPLARTPRSAVEGDKHPSVPLSSLKPFQLNRELVD
jgi:hypothetical protein